MMSLLIPTLLLTLVSPTQPPHNTDAKAKSQTSLNFNIQRQSKQPAALKRRPVRPNPKVIAANIEKLVREEFSLPYNGEREHWSFDVNKKNKQLTVTELGTRITLDTSDPQMLPFSAQYNAEALTRFFPNSDIPARQWRPRLNAFRNAIRQTISIIESTRKRAQLLKALEQQAALLDRSLEGLKEFIINFYKAKGYEVFSTFGGALSIPVPVVTAPAGGTIKVMKYLNYQKCLVFGIPINLWPWLTLNQDTAHLLGRYRYFVSWPDGRTAEGTIRIVSTDRVVFR